MKITRNLTSWEMDAIKRMATAAQFNYSTIEEVYRRIGTINATDKILRDATSLGISPIKMIEIIESYGTQ